MGTDWRLQAALALFEHSEDSCALVELAGSEFTVHTVNPALARMLGRDPEEFAGQPGAAFYPPAELDDVVRRVRETLEAGQPRTYEAERELPRGRVVIRATMIPLDDGRVVAIGRDVSRERSAERQLGRLEVLADIGLWGWNVVDDELIWSDNYRRVHGLAMDAPARLEDALALIHPEDRADVEEVIRELSTAGRTRPIRYRIVRPDGEVRHVEGRGQVFRDVDGRLVRAVGTVQDVTEQELLERQHRRYRQARDRQAHALELNDDIVQTLSRAWLALELGDHGAARAAIEDTTRRVQDIVRGLLETTTSLEGTIAPGDLLRRRPAAATDDDPG